MSRIIDNCPYCNGLLKITEVSCPSCDISIAGKLFTSRLARLPLEQQRFLEKFILASGSLKAMSDELGMSYPTARARLSDVIRALGYEVREEAEPVSVEERKTILEQLASGDITSEAAVQLLKGE